MKAFLLILILVGVGVGFICGSMVEHSLNTTKIARYEQIIQTQNEYLLRASQELYETKLEYSLEIARLKLLCRIPK